MIPHTIIFYDNEEQHIQTLKKNVPHVEGVLINHDLKNRLGDKKTYNQYWIQQGNTYARANQDDMKIDPTEGFNKDHAKHLLSHVRRGEKIIAIFDWDRTLNVVEGVSLPPNGHRFEQYGVHPEHAIEYQMGGTERLEWLRDMFRQLDRFNVPVFILTSNKNCSQTKSSFLTHIQRLIPSLTDDKLICAGSSVGLDKSEALLQNETYQLITGHKPWSKAKVNIMVIVSILVMILAFLFSRMNRAQMGVFGKKGELTSYITIIKSLLDKAGITLTKSRILNYIEENPSLSRDEQHMLISLMDYTYKELVELIKQNDWVKFILKIEPYDIIKTILDGWIGTSIQNAYSTEALSQTLFTDENQSWWDWDAWFEGSEGSRIKNKRKSRKRQ